MVRNSFYQFVNTKTPLQVKIRGKKCIFFLKVFELKCFNFIQPGMGHIETQDEKKDGENYDERSQ